MIKKIIMQHYKNIFSSIIIILSLLLHSCEKTIDLEIKDNERKITINSIFNCDSLINVFVYKSVSILEPDTLFYLDNAVIKLYENSNIITDFNYQENGEYLSSLSSDGYGKEYEIKAESKGLETVSALSLVPNPVQIIKIDTISKLITESYDSYYTYEHIEFEIQMEFQDPPDIENYYALVVKTSQVDWDKKYTDTSNIDTTYYTYRNTSIITTDYIIMNDLSWEIGNVNLFDDKLIDGKDYSLDFKLYFDTYDVELNKQPIQVELRSIPKELYLYYISYSNQQSSKDKFLSEPVQVYSNITDGYGIFAGYSSDAVTINRK